VKYKNEPVSIDRGIDSCLKTLNDAKPPNSIIAICSVSIEYTTTSSLRLAIIRRIAAETTPRYRNIPPRTFSKSYGKEGLVAVIGIDDWSPARLEAIMVMYMVEAGSESRIARKTTMKIPNTGLTSLVLGVERVKDAANIKAVRINAESKVREVI
jgi:hypothetical protein